MTKRFLILAAAAFLLAPAPVLAGAGNFVLINGAGADLSGLSIRRTGTTSWRALPASPAAGAAASIMFNDPDCAFDLKADLAGMGTAQWNGVNLCGTSRLTLRRRASGETWVDYD